MGLWERGLAFGFRVQVYRVEGVWDVGRWERGLGFGGLVLLGLGLDS